MGNSRVLSFERKGKGLEGELGLKLGSQKRSFNKRDIVINMLYLLYKSKCCMIIS